MCVFSCADNSIVVPQRRSAVISARHNAIWEISAGRIKAGVNPDRLSSEEMTTEFTNHFIQGAVLSSEAIGTLPELQAARFSCAK